jgi:putative ABC transport system ATP-binding protein
MSLFRGQTVVLVTHDAEVGTTCDRIIRMRDGRIVADARVTTEREAAA